MEIHVKSQPHEAVAGEEAVDGAHTREPARRKAEDEGEGEAEAHPKLRLKAPRLPDLRLLNLRLPQCMRS